MIHLDSAAVVKLVRQEAHSADLVTWLNAHDDAPLVSSALVEVEVPRALRRSAPQALVGVPAAVGRLFRRPAYRESRSGLKRRRDRCLWPGPGHFPVPVHARLAG